MVQLILLGVIAAASVGSHIFLEGQPYEIYFWTLAASIGLYIIFVLLAKAFRDTKEGFFEIAHEQTYLLLIIYIVLTVIPTLMSLLSLIRETLIAAGGVAGGLIAIALVEAYDPKGKTPYTEDHGHYRIGYKWSHTSRKLTVKDRFERQTRKGEWEKTNRIERFIIRYVLLVIAGLVSYFFFKSSAVTVGLTLVFLGMTVYLIAKRK